MRFDAGSAAAGAATGGARNFQISVLIIFLVVLSFGFFAFTHASLSRADVTGRLSRRTQFLQSQIDLMIEKSKVETRIPYPQEETAVQGKDVALAVATTTSSIEGLSDPTSSKFATARELSLRFNTRYWLENRLHWPKEPLPMKEKFLSFEPWQGGFNNIRMSLEMAAAMAMALDRTLVLPPRYKMYLRGESSFQDYFDYEDLRKGFSTVSYEEFRKIMNLGKYDKLGDDVTFNKPMGEYFSGLKSIPNAVIIDNGHPLITDQIGSQIVLCFPKCPTSGSENTWFEGVKHKLHPIDVQANSNIFHDPKVIHFGPVLLGHFYTLVWFQDPRIGAKVKRAVRDHIHFREELFVLAEQVIQALGGDFSFSCLHVRRNDFQFKEVWTPAEDIVSNIGGLFEKNETIYISTDELSVAKEQQHKLWSDPLAMSKVKNDHEWFKPMFQAWGGRDRVKFWSDYYLPLMLDQSVKKIWIGSVESIVCSRARVFVGTRKSTFSGYIHRMRGYMRDVGQKELFEAQAVYPKDYYYSLIGVSWSRFPHGAFGGGHPYWGREYKEAWEGVDNPLY